MIDIAQIIYALERQARALEEQADRLGQQHDYSAEFPAVDAERMREAITMLTRRKDDRRKIFDLSCGQIRREGNGRRHDDRTRPYTALPQKP